MLEKHWKDRKDRIFLHHPASRLRLFCVTENNFLVSEICIAIRASERVIGSDGVGREGKKRRLEPSQAVGRMGCL